MFEQTFTFIVPTDGEGRFHSTKAVSSPFTLDVKITAALQTPAGTTLHGSFSLVPATGPVAEPVSFSLSSAATADLGKWKAVAGDDANVATAEGYTEPSVPNAEITVAFTAAPSFF